MNKSFKKNLIAASVGLTLAGAIAPAMAAGLGTTNLLFPYVSAANGAYTFITIVNRGAAAGTTSTDWGYHFSYGLKQVTAPNFSTTAGASACEHADGRGRTTPNDIMQFEMRNQISLDTARVVIPTSPSSSGPDTTSVPYYWGGSNNAHGFLIVNGSHGGVPEAGTGYMGGVIYGEAVVVDTATGMRVAYSSNNLNTIAAADPDFTIDNIGITGGVIPTNLQNPDGGAPNSVNIVTWYPTSAVTTSWFVAPLGLRSEMTPSANGGLWSAYRMYATAYGDYGAYDQNEAFHSGAPVAPVQCLGVLTRANLLNSTPLANTVNSGWSNLVTWNNDGTSGDAVLPPAGFSGALATDAAMNKSLVYKIQSTGALGGAMSFISRENDL